MVMDLFIFLYSIYIYTYNHYISNQYLQDKLITLYLSITVLVLRIEKGSPTNKEHFNKLVFVLSELYFFRFPMHNGGHF